MFEINFDDEEELTLPTEEAEQTPAVAEEAEKITTVKEAIDYIEAHT